MTLYLLSAYVSCSVIRFCEMIAKMAGQWNQPCCGPYAELDLAGKQKQLTACCLIKRACYKHLQGDAEGADADFELAVANICIQHSPSAAMHFAQAVMYFAKANLSAALKHLDKAHAQEPGIDDILHLRGLVKHLLGDHWGAIKDLDGRARSKRSFWKLASTKFWLGFHNYGMLNIMAAHSLAMS